MKQILHELLKEYQQLKNKKEITDVQPSINGEKNSLAFNILWASLFASNRNLSGEFLTMDFLRDKEMSIREEVPKITFLKYNFSNTLIFLEEDVKKILPQFDLNDENEVYKLKKAFESNKINSFATDIKDTIEKDLGAVYEVNFGKTILNYNKIEAIPIEYVQGIKQEAKKELTNQEKDLKNRVENIVYENFEEALQYFYFLIKNIGKVNVNILNNFELYEFGAGADLIVKYNNNFILSQYLHNDFLSNKILKTKML